MPVYEITGPDGKKFKVNAPKGANAQDAINHVQETYYSSAPAGKDRSKMSLGEKLLDSPVGGFLRGLRDIPDGGAQLLTRGLEAISPAGSDMEKFFKGERERVESINNAAEQDYQQNFRQGGVDGLDTGRLIGNVVAGYPIAKVLPMAASSAPMLSRVATGALSGGASAALQPVGAEGQDNFANNKIEQVAIGGAFGGVSPFIADAIGKAASKFVRKPTAQQLEINLQGQLEKQGIDFSKLSDQVKASLLKDAQEALKTGGTLDPKAAALKSDFEMLDMNPMLGQITRDPMQFAFEKNTRGIQGAGEPIAQRLNSQSAKLIENLNKLGAGSASDKYAANAQVQAALKNVDNTREAAKNALFRQARDAAGRDLPLSPFNFTQGLNKELDYQQLGSFLPGELRTNMNKIAAGDAPFTLQEAQQLLKLANNHFDKTGQQGSMNKAIGVFKDHINSVIDDAAANSADDLGAEAAQKFRIANKAARQQFRSLEKSPALKAAVENEMPDHMFIDKFILSDAAKPREVLNLRAQLRNAPDVWDEVKRQILDHLKFDKALNKSNDEVGTFSQSAYNKALDKIADAKLKILFSPDEVETLKRVGRVSAAIQKEPAGSIVNNSGTSQALANLMTRLSGVPYLKELAINPIMNFKLQGKVNSALNPSLQAITSPATLDPKLISKIQLPLAISGYPSVKGLLE